MSKLKSAHFLSIIFSNGLVGSKILKSVEKTRLQILKALTFFCLSPLFEKKKFSSEISEIKILNKNLEQNVLNKKFNYFFPKKRVRPDESVG